MHLPPQSLYALRRHTAIALAAYARLSLNPPTGDVLRRVAAIPHFPQGRPDSGVVALNPVRVPSALFSFTVSRSVHSMSPAIVGCRLRSSSRKRCHGFEEVAQFPRRPLCERSPSLQTSQQSPHAGARG